MKKILFSLMAIALVVGLVGAGAFAYFSDSETSTGNTFTAGTLDVTLSGSPDGDNIWVTPVEVPADWAPGETVEGTLALSNTGTIDIGWIGVKPINVTPTEPNPMGVTLDSDFSTRIIISQLIMSDGVTPSPNLAPLIANWGVWGPADGVLTLADFASGPNYLYSEPGDLDFDTDGTVTVYMEFTFDPAAGNYYQSADCTFDLEVIVLQNVPEADGGGPKYFTHVDVCGYGE